ncbi:hypothetical protein MMC24_006977 [Lignoscripta atroalba]|nr:hypothetical protein [Lignoscripta atroalba]
MLLPFFRYGAHKSQLNCIPRQSFRITPRKFLAISPIHHARSSATWTPGLPEPAFNLPIAEETQSIIDNFRSKRPYHEVHDVEGQEFEDEVDTQKQLRFLQRTNKTSKNPLATLPSENTPISHDSIIKAQGVVLEALQQENPQKLLSAYLLASKDKDYVRSIPTTTFLEILQLLDPKHFVEPFKAAHRDLHAAQISYLRDGTKQLEDIFAEYVTSIRVLMQRRQDAGHRFGISEYRSLLKMTAAVGDGEAAWVLWNAMRSDGVEPDTQCFNLYFGARCWSKAFDPAEREKLRVIPYHLASRLPVKRGEQKKEGFRGYTTGNRGLKNEVITHFDYMVKRGLTADVDTFIMLISAMAREGDLPGVQSILKRVWDIDVEALMEGDDQFMGHQNNLSRASPLYPTPALLFTIAHAFGSNNELPVALRVVDHVSRKYSIKINVETWAQLLEWTFVLSTRRYKGRKVDGAQIGQLPLRSVDSLWKTMISEPYNIQPTMPMYNRYVRNLWKRQMVDRMLEVMRAGKELHLKQERRYMELANITAAAENRAWDESSDLPMEGSQSLTALRQETEVQCLYEYRDFLMVSRWVRLVFAGNKWDHDLEWERRGAPTAVARFWRYMPFRSISYNISSGRIDLRFETLGMLHLKIQTNKPDIALIRRGYPLKKSEDEPVKPARNMSKRHIQNTFLKRVRLEPSHTVG